MTDDPHEEQQGDKADADESEGGDGINDPLTRSDVEAPRAPFGGSSPGGDQ